MSVARHYTHRTEIDGATISADVLELQYLIDQAAAWGMTRESLADALAERTGFAYAVRGFFGVGPTPNGLMRRVILNNARQLVSELGP